MKKNNSNEVILKVSDVLFKAGISLSSGGNPAAVALYDITKIGMGRLRDYVNSRNEERISSFYKNFLYKENDILCDEVINANIKEADFHALLQACLSDIENEKTIPYAHLMRSIALGKVNISLRRHYITSLNDISWGDLDLLRRAYVLSKHPIIPEEGAGCLAVESILDGYDIGSLEHLSVVNLTAKGFINGAKLSELGEKFVESCSISDELQPFNYGYSVWSKLNLIIFFLSHHDDDDELSKLLKEIQKILREKHIKYENVAYQNALSKIPGQSGKLDFAIVLYKADKNDKYIKNDTLEYIIGGKPYVEIALGEKNSKFHGILGDKAVSVKRENIESEVARILKSLLSQ
jgi:hypothetical protein